MNPAELHNLIHARKTEKILAPVDAPPILSPEVLAKNNPLVRTAVESAGMAPFHYPRTSEIAEPWRAHILWNEQTNTLASYLANDLKDTTKVPKLTSAASALILITWLPQFPDSTNEKQKCIDQEHLSAASAMTQNLLLLLTSHGFSNYWSSGGALGTPELFRKLEIPQEEALLGAIFIQYPEARRDAQECSLGAHRNKRSHKWIREVNYNTAP